MMGPGAHIVGESSRGVGGPRREATGAGIAAGPPVATQVPENASQQQRGAAMFSGDGAHLRFKKVWGSQGTGDPPTVLATAANGVEEARGKNSNLAAVLQHQQLGFLGPVSSYSAGFSRLSASLSKAATPAVGASAPEHSRQNVSPPVAVFALKAEASDVVDHETPQTVYGQGRETFHYQGTPSTGRLVPLGRLHAYDPTVEGRIEAFIAECCDAAGNGNRTDEGDTACISASAADAERVPFAAVDGRGTGTTSGPGEVSKQEQQNKRLRSQIQQLRVTAAVGSLTGKYTGWKISLPVALPAMLEEQAEANVKFEEALGEAYADAAEAHANGGTHAESGSASSTRKEREEEGPRQSPVLRQLLQRLLEARRQAYELLPVKRICEVVERRSNSARQGGHHLSMQKIEEEDEEESGLGGARVLRYRLVDIPVAASQQQNGTRTLPPCADASEPPTSGGAEGNVDTTHQRIQPEQPPDHDKCPKGGAPLAGRDVMTEEKQNWRVMQEIPTEGHAASERRNPEQKHQQWHAIEVVERIPLGCRFIYRPKSDRHIRLAAESEVISSARLPLPYQRPCQQQDHPQHPVRAHQREQQISQDEREAWQQHDAVRRRLQIEEGTVKQRWWAVHDVWQLRARPPRQNSNPVEKQGREQPKTNMDDLMTGNIDVEGPRWSLVITEEGEIEDCSSDSVVLLLQCLARNNHKAAAALLKISKSRTRYLSTRLGTAAPSEGTLESAEDVDRYEETKRTSIQLVACGAEMQHQRAKQEQLHKNVFGALALLLVENAQVLARWFDESLEGIAHVPPPRGGMWYYPNHMGDAVQAVQRHYDQRKLISAGRSRVTGLRLHNNQVKRMLIRKYVEQGQSVLELACGHGQDLWKYAERCISKFVGVDLSLSEIREARRRIREGHRSAQHMLQQMLCPPVFHVGNLVDARALNFLKAEQFDIVSIQLSIHYMVETEKQAGGVLTRAAAHLKEGGLLLGSTVCCDAIASRLLQLRPLAPAALLRGEQLLDPSGVAVSDARGDGAIARGKVEDGFEFGNDLYSVTFSKSTLRKLIDGYTGSTVEEVAKRLLPKQGDTTDAGPKGGSALASEGESLPLFSSVTSPAAQAALVEYLRDRLFREFGVAYHFYLADSIDAMEFVLPWRSFCAVAASVGLKLVSSMTFPEFLRAGAADPHCSCDIAKWFSTLTPSKQLDKPQFEVFSLYKIFAFKKVSTPTDTSAAGLPPVLKNEALKSTSNNSNNLTVRPVSGSIPQIAGREKTTGQLAKAIRRDGSASVPNVGSGINRGTSRNSSNSSSNNSDGRGSNQGEEDGTTRVAESGAAQESMVALEGEATGSGAAAGGSSGGGLSVPEEGIKQYPDKRFVEGVPLKRRKRRNFETS